MRGIAGLEPKHETCGRLGGVCGRTGMQSVQSKVWALIYEATVFGAKSEVFEEVIVGAAAIDEDRFRLAGCAGAESSGIARWIKYQRTGAGQKVRSQFDDSVRHGNHEYSRRLVHISLDVKRAGRRDILLRVPCITIGGIRGEPAIEVVAVA